MKLHNLKKVFTLIMANILLFSGIFVKTYAAPASVTVDEAMYVNLDYYGTISDTTIVKGYSLNGNTEFTDFGKYKNITNMTNHVNPENIEDGIKWNLPEGLKRFYFECTPENNIELPWNFDVSYKLNGVPYNADKLVGASGLVEINIHCIPNEKSEEYYRNNMLLQVASIFDMEKVYSLEAPGAQLQTMGSHKAVIFAALPGEDMTYTMRIGSDCFETTGITILMIPGTLEQFEKIKDLKEAKDTLKDSADSIYDSVNSILGVIEGMDKGINETKEGLQILDNAREYINNSKDDVYANTDKLLESLEDISKKTNELIPHIQNAQNLISTLNSDINNIMDTINQTKEHLNKLSKIIDNIQKDLKALQDMIADFNDKKEDRKEITDNLSKNLNELTTTLTWLKNDLDKIGDDTEDLRVSTMDFRNNLNPISVSIPIISSDIDPSQLPAELGTIVSILYTTLNEFVSSTNSALDDACSHFNYALDKSTDIVNDLSDFLKSSQDVFVSLEMFSERGKEISSSLNDTIDLANTYFDLIDEHYENADNLITELQEINDSAQNLINIGVETINDANKINDTLNNYEPDMLEMLNKLSDVTESLTKSLDSANIALSSIKDIIQNSGKYLNDGSKKTIDGVTDILTQSLNGISITPSLRNTNNTIKNTIDDEIDNFEKDNNFINIDSTQNFVSFTSDKNLTPDSIQIILRTDEISLDTEDDEITDYEIEKDTNTFIDRLKNIFIKIWTKIEGIFN